jgi:hypothetical protein
MEKKLEDEQKLTWVSLLFSSTELVQKEDQDSSFRNNGPADGSYLFGQCN